MNTPTPMNAPAPTQGTSRPIDLIVLHCSATPEGVSLPPSALRRLHVEQNGWSDVGYHFYVTRDGDVHPCRPLGQPGAHARGYNQRSVGICYEGGLLADGRTPADTRTPAQRRSLLRLIGSLRQAFPHARILGHRDLPGVRKACPAFDAAAEYGPPTLG